MQIEYRRNLQHNYLVISGEELESEDHYSVQMLVKNQIHGLLSCDFHSMDNRLLFYYDVTSKISLKERGKCKKITGNEVLMLWNSLLKTVETLDEYLLSGCGLFIDLEYIYIDAAFEQVSFCFLPGREASLDQGLEKLMEDLLPLLEHKDPLAVQVGYGLHQYMTQTPFSLEGIKEKINSFPGETDKVVPEEMLDTEREETYHPKDMVHEAALQAFFEDEEKEEGDSRKNYFITAGAGVLLLYGFTGWYLWRNFPNYFLVWIVITCIGGIAGMLFWKKKKTREEAEPYREGKVDEAEEMDKDFTQLLHAGQKKKEWYLIEAGSDQRIWLKKNSTLLIGKLQGTADVILPSPAISRLHARIRTDEMQVYITDLNSRNGTSVNGIEITSEQEIFQGDEICFADVKYLLCLK